MAENPKLRAWRIRVLAEKNKLGNFPQVEPPVGPSMAVVISVKRLLLGLKLPLEIVDLILDHAEFWPHTTCTTQYRTVVYSDSKSGLWVRDWRSLPFSMDHGPIPENYRIMPKNAFLLRTHPLGLQARDPTIAVKSSIVARWKQKLRKDRRRKSSTGPTWLPPRGLHPCRKIVFEILSHQEAMDFTEPWYGDSPTWLDVSVERILPEEDPTEAPIWTPSMNDEWGDELMGRTPDSAKLLLLKRVPGAATPFDRQPKQASPTSSILDNQPIQLFETRRTKPSLAATTRQAVVQQNYQGDAVNRQHVVTWRYDDAFDMESTEGDELLTETGMHMNSSFVREMESGESIVLWARARDRPRNLRNQKNGKDPCINVVDRVRMHVFWAV
ncbi:MAG: hypothetical protein LQ343_002953 [Gyalolechia ehrenbergii]|nr:MAG: hypothetical protein LQ343_002953 [Gyalolechia ehrenbergii]